MIEDQQPPRTCSTGVELADRLCCWRITRSRSRTKPTATVCSQCGWRPARGVQHPVEQVEVMLILFEQRSGQHVAEEQHDSQHFVVSRRGMIRSERSRA